MERQRLRGRLPILISVPHGGNLVPDYFKKNCLLSEKDILLDGDTWTKDLYDFRESVEEYIYTDIARAVIDMNRKEDDLPPMNPDGVVKTIAVDGKEVWDKQLTSKEIEMLVTKYLKPYHKRLEEGASNPRVKLAIDCHTMLDIGPTKDRSKWEKRPLICISNRGDASGKRLDEPITAPPELMGKFKRALEEEFREYSVENEDVPLVAINHPFKGGYITTRHGSLGHIPWIQLEINRKLYLPTNEEITLEPSADSKVILKDIRDRMYNVFEEILA